MSRFKPWDLLSRCLQSPELISLGFTSAAASLKFGRSSQRNKYEAGYDLKIIGWRLQFQSIGSKIYIENHWSNDMLRVITNFANHTAVFRPLLPRARLMPQAYLWRMASAGCCAPSFYLLKSVQTWLHMTIGDMMILSQSVQVHSLEIKQNQIGKVGVAHHPPETPVPTQGHLSRCQRPRPQLLEVTTLRLWECTFLEWMELKIYIIYIYISMH